MNRIPEGLQKALFVIALFSLVAPGIVILFHLAYTGNDSVAFIFELSSLGGLLMLYYVCLFCALVALGAYWLIKQINRLLSLRTEKIKAEIMLLSAEVNPHFFFNMLNNLYALVGRDPSLAREVIMRLSDMMRYSIYEGKKEQVSLKDEIDFINNYINLHRVRYHREIDVVFEVALENDQLEIAPLLFIILVENAFKHGIETMARNGFVHMKLQSSGEAIIFEVENNFDGHRQSGAGIGLANLRRRLELLYPKRGQLETETRKDTYYSKLALILK